jgi:hypothetical protein
MADVGALRSMQLLELVVGELREQNELLRAEKEIAIENARIARMQLEQSAYQSSVLFEILGTLRATQTAPPAVPHQH